MGADLVTLTNARATLVYQANRPAESSDVCSFVFLDQKLLMYGVLIGEYIRLDA